jgi:hypothetical protein
MAYHWFKHKILQIFCHEEAIILKHRHIEDYRNLSDVVRRCVRRYQIFCPTQYSPEGVGLSANDSSK